MNPLLSLLLALPALRGPAQEAPVHPAEFWRGIVEQGHRLPEGDSAFELLVELSSYLGSPDPALRDDCAYGIAAAWIVRRQLLDEDELRALCELWSRNLEVEIGAAGDDSVLLRSFSALDLSLIAAYDAEHPFLGDEGYAKLLESALGYLERERDLRGWVEGLGWCHAAAHTADLLKFLARSPRLDPAGQYAILAGVARRLRETDGYVFVHGEDERLAAVAVSILGREDLDTEAFEDFLGELAATAKLPAEFDPRAFAALQNSKNLLRALHVRLALAGDLSPPLAELRGRVLATLAKL